MSAVSTTVSIGERLAESEFALTEGDFRQIASVLHGDCGIALTDTKATLVYSRLAGRLRALGLESFRQYCELIVSEDGFGERQRMVAALTTNVTSFFRERHHLEHLTSTALPALIEHAKAGGRVRLWSAGCSTGQEAYSMALTLLSLAPDIGEFDVRILATDIDPNVIAVAREGIYSDALVAPVPQALRALWMNRLGRDRELKWSMSAAVRALVSFRELNLVGQWPMRGRFDLIFCRNVVIYFEEQTQAQVWARLADHLVPNGRLYIGHSERLNGPAAELFTSDGLTTYRLKGAAR